jgi:hypothetical protein
MALFGFARKQMAQIGFAKRKLTTYGSLIPFGLPDEKRKNDKQGKSILGLSGVFVLKHADFLEINQWPCMSWPAWLSNGEDCTCYQ